MKEFRVAFITLLTSAAAAACAPPPEPPPDPPEWIPTEVCIEPRVPGEGIAFVYHGPEDTRFNTTGYVAGDGSECVGDGLRLGNIVRSATEAPAVAKCEELLPEFSVSGARQLIRDFDVPADAWICEWGP